MSINDPESFMQFIQAIVELFFDKKKHIDPKLVSEFMESMEQPPYIFIKVILGVYFQLPLE
jgi:hypothetical protein